MKSEKLFFKVLIVQCSALIFYQMTQILLGVLSGEKFRFDLVVQLISLIFGSYGLYVLMFKISNNRFAMFAATTLITFLAALMSGVIFFLPGGVTWDIFSIGMTSITITGTGAFLHYFFVGKRGTT